MYLITWVEEHYSNPYGSIIGSTTQKHENKIVGDSIYGMGTAYVTYIETYEEQQFLGPLPTVEDLLAIDDIDPELA